MTVFYQDVRRGLQKETNCSGRVCLLKFVLTSAYSFFFFLTDFKRLEYSCTSPAMKPFLLHGIASAEPNSSGFHTFSTTYVVSLQKLTDVQQEKPTCIHLAGRRDTCSALGQAKQIPYEIPGLYFQSKDLYQELHHPIILKHMSSVSEWVSSEVTDCSHFQAL